MPEFFPRVEVHLDRETRSKVENLKSTLMARGARRLSTSRVCAEIIKRFFEVDGSLSRGG